MRPNNYIGAYILMAVILFLLLCIGKCAASDDICFDQQTAGNIVVELEKAKIMEKENALLKEGNNELEKQIDLLKQVIELKDKQINVLEKTNKEYDNLLKTQKDLYGEMIKNSKPSFFSKVTDALSFMGLGAIIGAILL
jgi:hypothetical protein